MRALIEGELSKKNIEKTLKKRKKKCWEERSKKLPAFGVIPIYLLSSS